MSADSADTARPDLISFNTKSYARPIPGTRVAYALTNATNPSNPIMHPHLPALLAALFATSAGANDLLQLYHAAKAGDTRLQAARFQRDALIEARPRALAQWLPRVDANASAARERLGYQFAQPQDREASGCELSAQGTMQRCSGSSRGYGLTLSQTLWSFEAYNRLKEADLRAASAQASLLGAEQDLRLRVS